MSGKAILGVAAAALVSVGIGWNLHPDTEVKTEHSVKIIRIPKYITHVKKETKEVIKNVGFPESCETAIDYGELSTDQSNRVNNRTKDLLNFIDEFDVKVLNGEDAVHSTEEGVGERVNRIDYLNYQLEHQAASDHTRAGNTPADPGSHDE